jgi:hypothetical protein
VKIEVIVELNQGVIQEVHAFVNERAAVRKIQELTGAPIEDAEEFAAWQVANEDAKQEIHWYAPDLEGFTA